MLLALWISLQVLLITCSNSGGPGQFHISREGLDPIGPGEVQNDSVQLGPFWLCPAAFALDRQEQMQLQIIFEPNDVKEHTQMFTLKCNNGTQTTHHLFGTGQTWLTALWLFYSATVLLLRFAMPYCHTPLSSSMYLAPVLACCRVMN